MAQAHAVGPGANPQGHHLAGYPRRGGFPARRLLVPQSHGWGCLVGGPGFDVPQHLYSHRVGTFLDSLLDDADGVAKRQATRARLEVGWIHGLQTPRVCFTHDTVQVHNLDRLVQATAHRLWLLHTEAPEQAVRKSLSVYHAVTERGLIRWGAHLRTMARQEGLGHAGDPRPCPACQREMGTRHWVTTCPWRHLFRLAVHTQLHMHLDTLCARWKRRAVSAWGVIVLYGPDAFALSVGSLDDDDPHPGPGVRTIYLDPFRDWEAEDLGYLYDRGLVVGAAPRLLSIVVNFWDALDRKREMPIIPAAREVYYRDAHRQTWDLATRVPDSFDPTAYEWGARPAMAGFWPGASLPLPVCERGQLTAVMPPRQQLPPDWGGSLLVLWYSDRPLPRAPGRWPRAVRKAQVVIIDGPGGLPARRLVWLITYGPPHHYMGLYETRELHDRRRVHRLWDMLLATLCMAGYQPRVTYQMLGLALQPSR